MAIDMFTFVDLYRRQLDTAAHLLDKGVAFAAENGIDEAEMLGWRLADDMHPLGFQLAVVIDFSKMWLARAAGMEAPARIAGDLDVAGLRAAIAAAKTYLAAFTPDQFAGRDDVPVSFEIMPGMAPTLPAGQWLSVFATTNIYFHISIAYGILRSKGVAIGKSDMFASGL